MAGRLCAAYPDVYMQTHVAENRDEVQWVRELFPEARSYLDVYTRAGLMNARSVLAHGVWLNDADRTAIRDLARHSIERFDIRPPSCDLKTANFSGGNQQKIVIAREMERDPDVLLVGQPTRGVDIGAIEFIHQQILALRDRGKAILLVSVELDEIRALSDRILVMFDGRIMGERLSGETSAAELGLLMAGASPSGIPPEQGQPDTPDHEPSKGVI